MKNSTLVICHTDVDYLNTLKEGLFDALKSIKTTKKATSAFNFILRQKPDFAILDGELDYNVIVDIVNTVRKKNIKTKFILTFTKCRKEIFCLTKTLHISGACCITDTSTQILMCMKKVKENQTYYTYTIESYFNSIQDERFKYLQTLTPLELQTLSLLGPYQEKEKIADLLNLNTQKIEMQLDSIKIKLNKEQCEDDYIDDDSLISWATKNNSLITSLAIHKV